MTRFDRIKEMSIDEMAEKAVYEIGIGLPTLYVSGFVDLAPSAYRTREEAVNANKAYLSQEVSV